MGGILLYLVCAVYTLYIALLYNSLVGLLLCLAEIIIPCLLYIIVWIQVSEIDTVLNIPMSVMERATKANIEIKIKNNSIFPVNHINMVLVVENSLVGKREKIRVKAAVEGKGEQTVLCKIKSESSGMLNISLTKIRIYDMMGILFRQIKKVQNGEMIIYPSIHETKVQVSEYVKRFPIESDEYDKFHGGDDSSEVFRTREYQEGDKIQAMHWKLSARTNQWMINEYSLPIGCAVLLMVDWCREELFLEMAASISFSLIDAECAHYGVWFDPILGDLKRVEIKTEEDGYLFIRLLLQTEKNNNSYSMLELYREKYRGETFASVISLERNFQILINERRAIEVDKRKLSENLRFAELKI